MRKIISHRISSEHTLTVNEAIQWVQIAKQYKSGIYFYHKGMMVDSKRIERLVSLFLTLREEQLLLIAEGEDAAEAIQELSERLKKPLQSVS